MTEPIDAYEPSWRIVLAVCKKAGTKADPQGRLSVADADVPAWQRGAVWSGEQKGMLALSMLEGYPIGQILLWEKPGRVFVPIDGRQRLTAITQFRKGEITIPAKPWVNPKFRGRRYCSGTHAEHDGAKCPRSTTASRTTSTR